MVGLPCPAPSSGVQAQALGPHLTLGSCLLLSLSPITPPWYLPSFLIVDYNVLSTFFEGKKKTGGWGVGRKEKEQISRNCFAAAVPVTWSKAVCHPPSYSGWQKAWVLPLCLSLPSNLSLSSCTPPPSKEKQPRENCRAVTYLFLREQLSL